MIVRLITLPQDVCLFHWHAIEAANMCSFQGKRLIFDGVLVHGGRDRTGRPRRELHLQRLQRGRRAP